jgi:hypothetical protein
MRSADDRHAGHFPGSFVFEWVQPKAPQEDHSMPQGRHFIGLSVLGVTAIATALPAWGQTITPDINGNARIPGWSVPQSSLYQRPPASWSTVPVPQAGLPAGGMTQSQAMDRLAAEGFTDILPPQPTGYGGWTGYASFRGRKVRATVDSGGKISVKK